MKTNLMPIKTNLKPKLDTTGAKKKNTIRVIKATQAPSPAVNSGNENMNMNMKSSFSFKPMEKNPSNLSSSEMNKKLEIKKVAYVLKS